MRNEQKLIIDCDPGVDDALAILYAAKNIHKYSDISITTVAGNVGCNQTTANAIKLAAIIKSQAAVPAKPNIKIYRGCSMSMDGKYPSAASVHGRDGLGEVPIRLLDKDLDILNARRLLEGTKKDSYDRKKNAVGFFSEFISKRKKKEHQIDLVCIGPLTNIATVLNLIGKKQHERFWSCFRNVVIMGGAIHVPGNMTPFAEFNFYADPMAAKIVLDSWKNYYFNKNKGATRLVLVPLDVTEKNDLHWDEMKPETGGTVVARFVSSMLQKYFLFHAVMANPVRKKGGGPIKNVDEYRKELKEEYNKKRLGGSSGLKSLFRFCYLHDPLAIHVVLNFDEMQEKGFFKEMTLTVSTDPGETRGMCIEVTSRPVPLESIGESAEIIHKEGAPICYLNPEVYKNIENMNENGCAKKFRESLLECLGFKIL